MSGAGASAVVSWERRVHAQLSGCVDPGLREAAARALAGEAAKRSDAARGRDALEGFDPDTVHLWVGLTGAIETDPATRSIAELFRASHRACHARVVQDALSAHLTVEEQAFDWLFDGLDESRGPFQSHSLQRSTQCSKKRFGAFPGLDQEEWMVLDAAA